MKTTQQHKLTDRLAPLLPGLYSMQAVSEDPDLPDITVYRLSAKEADEWKNHMVIYGCYKWFLLRSDLHRWDIFDSAGNFVEKSQDVLSNPIAEVYRTVEVDRDAFVREARDSLGDEDWSMIACAESHAGASAADHSNYMGICRLMIMDAEPGDMDNICIVASKSWECRVSGVFARIGSLSPDMQNFYLDRFKWFSKSWPILREHYRDTLAGRLASCRAPYVMEILEKAGLASNMPRELILSMLTEWSLASPGAKYRLTQHIVKTLKERIVFKLNEAETFEESHIEYKSSELVSDYRSRLLM